MTQKVKIKMENKPWQEQTEAKATNVDLQTQLSFTPVGSEPSAKIRPDEWRHHRPLADALAADLIAEHPQLKGTETDLVDSIEALFWECSQTIDPEETVAFFSETVHRFVKSQTEELLRGQQGWGVGGSVDRGTVHQQPYKLPDMPSRELGLQEQLEMNEAESRWADVGPAMNANLEDLEKACLEIRTQLKTA